MSQPEPRPRVVVVDDHPSVLAVLVRMLEQSCEVLASAATGGDGIAAVERLRPDILVVDLMLPDTDGLAVCRRIKQTSPATAVVVVTAFADPEVEAAAIRDGAAAFLAKPLATTSLAETIQRVFAERTVG